MGEPAGVGPELLLRAAARAEGRRREARILLFGNPAVFSFYARRAGLPLPKTIRPTGQANFRFRPGRPSPDSGREAGAALDAAIDAVLRGEADALVTAPVDKTSFQKAGYGKEGHTAYLQRRCGVAQTMMVFVDGDGFGSALLSVHKPLKDAVRSVSRRGMADALFFLRREWKRLFGRAPRIAVAGLNPHAGESGLLGSEEEKIIAPAIRDARRKGIRAAGPFAPDTMYPRAKREGFDAALFLYHDQGLIAVKSASPFGAVNLTLGLPFVRTSPDHGVAYDVAASGRDLETGGMEAAVRLAARLASQERKGLK